MKSFTSSPPINAIVNTTSPSNQPPISPRSNNTPQTNGFLSTSGNIVVSNNRAEVENEEEEQGL